LAQLLFFRQIEGRLRLARERRRMQQFQTQARKRPVNQRWPEMSTTWNTKWGPRRVRVELPTLEEALDAAAGLSTNTAEQIQIAAGLMEQGVGEIRPAAERILRERSRRPQMVRSSSGRQTVIVERKSPRRFVR
jgi:hypothetical protein